MRRANKSKSIIDWDNFIKKPKNQVTKLKNKLKQEYLNNLLSEDAKTAETALEDFKNTGSWWQNLDY